MQCNDAITSEFFCFVCVQSLVGVGKRIPRTESPRSVILILPLSRLPVLPHHGTLGSLDISMHSALHPAGKGDGGSAVLDGSIQAVTSVHCRDVCVNKGSSPIFLWLT